MTEIASLYGPVTEDIPLVGERLLHLQGVREPLLTETLSYLFQTSGKRVRPALVLLCGKLGRYERDRLITLAASLEVVHFASLVHDDTIDQALSRHGLATISAVWDSKVAILVGDFLFAQSAYLAALLDSVPVMSLLSETVMAMVSGEIRQYTAVRNRTIDEADYFGRIAGKTASLFSMCCSGAGIISHQSEQEVEALRRYGTNLGLAFQIADDVLDIVGDEDTLGKPAGGDLRQGTVTLPSILFLQDRAPNDPLRRAAEQRENVDAVVTAIRESDAPVRAIQRAEEYASLARGELSMFPPSEAKEALLGLTESVVARSH